MRYLLPASTYQRLYYYKTKILISQISAIHKTLKHFFFRNEIFYASNSVDYYFLTLFFYIPRFRHFRRICWFNSKSRWVSRSFNFGRGYLKRTLFFGRIPGYKPNAWLFLHYFQLYF